MSSTDGVYDTNEILRRNLSVDSQMKLKNDKTANFKDADIPCLDVIPKSSCSLISNMKASLICRMKKQCSKLLGGPWDDPSKVTITEQTGGLSNYLYIASVNSDTEISPEIPRKVLIRIYGEILRSNTDSLILDSIVFAILSEKKIGPMLHGVFSGGRIEQFIDSRNISRSEFRSKQIYPLIARKLAKFNSFPMPMHKSNSIIKTAEIFINQIKSPATLFKSQTQLTKESIDGIDLGNVNLNEESKVQQKLCNKAKEIFQRFDLDTEITWIKKKILEDYKDLFSLAFCHNDLQYNNILIAPIKDNDKDVDLLLIDFEYCSYNFRGFDIGNVLNEWSLDYSRTYSDGFKYIPEDVPTLEEQMDFLRHYLSESAQPNESGHLTSEERSVVNYRENLLEQNISVKMVSLDDKRRVVKDANDLLAVDPKYLDLLEVQYGMLLSHLFWGVWSFVQGFMSNIEFNYVGYAELRLELYQNCKKAFIKDFEKDSAKLFK